MEIFSAEKFVEWKKKKGFYAFDQFPKTAIISAQDSTFKNIKTFFTKRIKSISGKNFLYSDKILLSSGFGIGAPALVALCEELRCLGIENFYFIGIAGRLTTDIKEADILEISNAISELGVTSSYFDTKTIKNSNNLEIDLKAKKTICWSTDAPYRETSEKILIYKELGAELVDMETAGLFSFAKHYNLNANAFLVAADLCTEKYWSEVENFKQIETQLQFIANQIIKAI